MQVSGLFGPRQTSPPSWQSSQCVWDGGFSHFPPAQQRSSKETLALCVFRCQRLNTGSFFSPLYGRLYSNLILNHTDTPCYAPFSGLLAWLYWWWTVKKNKGGVTAFRDYCLALKLFFSSFFSENIPVKCFLWVRLTCSTVHMGMFTITPLLLTCCVIKTGSSVDAAGKEVWGELPFSLELFPALVRILKHFKVFFGILFELSTVTTFTQRPPT